MDDRTRSAIARLDEAFEGDATHSLIANLATVAARTGRGCPRAADARSATSPSTPAAPS